MLLHDDKYILLLKTVNAETTFLTGFKWFVGTAAQADAKILELKLKAKSTQ